MASWCCSLERIRPFIGERFETNERGGALIGLEGRTVWVQFREPDELLDEVASDPGIAQLGVVDDNEAWIDDSVLPVAAVGAMSNEDEALGYLLYDSASETLLYGGVVGGYSRANVLADPTAIGLPPLPPEVSAVSGFDDPRTWRVVTGVVSGGPAVPVADVVAVAADRSSEVRHNHAFTLQVGDDSIAVEPAMGCTLLPRLSEAGEYGQLDGRLARACHSVAPGDHVEVELSGNLVKQGEHVAVLGPATETPRAGSGYRAPVRTIVTAVTAKAIGVGEDGPRAVEAWRDEQAEALEAEQRKHDQWVAVEQRRRERQRQQHAREQSQRLHPGPLSLWPASIPLLFAAGLIIGALFAGPTTASGRGFASLGLVDLAFAAFVWRRRRWFPEFGPLQNGGGRQGVRWALTPFFVAFSALQLAAFAIPLGGAAGLPPLGAVSTVFCVVCIVTVVRADRPGLITAGHLLGAKPLCRDAPASSSGSVEGRFHGTVRRREDIEAVMKTRIVWGTDEHGNRTQKMVTKTRYRTKGSWSGDTNASVELDGEYVGLVLPGAELGGMRLDVSTEPGSARGSGGNTATQHAGFAQVACHTGDSVLAMGRISLGPEGPYMEATGPGALILFGADGDTSARSALRRQRRLYYVGLGAMVLATLSAGALCFVP